MSEYFESIRKGAEEALAWKQGKDTGARVRQYTALDATEIRKKKNKNDTKGILTIFSNSLINTPAMGTGQTPPSRASTGPPKDYCLR